MTIKEDWKVSLSGGTKHSSHVIKSKDAKTSLAAWRIANGRHINRYGTKQLPHLLFGGLKSITKIKEENEPHKSLAHAIHDVIKENIGRGRSKSNISKGNHATGARRHQISKGIQKAKMPRKPRLKSGKTAYLKEVVASDQRGGKPQVKYSPAKGKYIIVDYNARRRTINLTGNSKVPKKFGGYVPFTNEYTGLPFGN
jgi:hypothetical protein